MNLEKLPEPTFVTQYDELQHLVEKLLIEPIIAVDTESNSLFAYQEQVCLIQFSTRKSDFLVDPLALQDLEILAPVFSEPGIEKVFHAAEYDLICLYRDFGFEFSNLFDTMVASRILGRDAVGLGSILNAEFGVNLDKRFQRANWGKRPLSADMLRYARLDTHFLIPLRNRLYAELEQKQLLALAEEDFNRLSGIRINGNGNQPGSHKPTDCWRISGSHDLDPKQAAVLFELCRYRDQVARTLDRPLFKVFSNKTLLAIAERMPNSLEELRQYTGMKSRQLKRHGVPLIKAVQRGKNSDPVYPPRNPRPDDHYLNRLDALRRWRKQAALDMGVPSDVVLPRDLMLSLASKNPNGSDELDQILSEVPWRREHFGYEILEILASREQK